MSDAPDAYDLWMQAGGHPDLYRRLRVAATETEPYPDLPHQPGDEHCGVGGAPKAGHPHYRHCSCGRWYYWTGSLWRPGRPSAQWLREHGFPDPGESWDTGEEPHHAGPFGEFYRTTRQWRYWLGVLIRRRGR